MTISPNKWELDVQGYLNTCNITSATPRQQIRDFAKGVNDLGLWSSMVCWPLRSSQNYGTGTTAFSLGGLGTFNGTLVGGPTWAADGSGINGGTATVITLDAPPQTAGITFGLVYQSTETSSDTRVPMTWKKLELAIGIGGLDCTSDAGVAIITSQPFSGSRNMFALTSNGNSGAVAVRAFRDGALSTTGSRTLTSTENTARLMNRQQNDLGITKASFCWMADAQYTDGQMADFYTLYKTTLGTGLGLP
jgi:hypothetical protein